jgi:hypothetical protein
MTTAEMYESLFSPKGVGTWRKLYLSFIEKLSPSSVIEFGAGDPQFLLKLDNAINRCAVDYMTKFQPAFEEAGIHFKQIDLNSPPENFSGEHYQVAICSDVFEHLQDPIRCLHLIKETIGRDGILFSHVPNEFTLAKTTMVMMGWDQAVYNHEQCEEWDHPHVHRFTKIGYRKFLGTAFKYHVELTGMRHRRLAFLLSSLYLPVPYCLEGGPTYASTNSPEVRDRLLIIRKQLHRRPLSFSIS